MHRRRTQRFCREEGWLGTGASPAGRIAVARTPILAPEGPNSRWSINFVHDQFATGRRFRVLSIIDDGTEFTSPAVLRFTQDRKVDWRTIAPGKPTQNPFAKSVQASMRDECLNEHLLFSMNTLAS